MTDEEDVHQGELIVIQGPMGSGKTGILLTVGKTESYRRKSLTCYILSRKDTRGDGQIMSRNGAAESALVVDNFSSTVEFIVANGFHCVIIDELHMFGDVTTDIQKMLNAGIDVIVSCLNELADGNPPPGLPEILKMATFTYTMRSRCHVCNKPARHSMALKLMDQFIQAGDDTMFAAACDDHFSTKFAPK